MKRFLIRFLKIFALLSAILACLYGFKTAFWAFTKWNGHWSIKIGLVIAIISAFCALIPSYLHRRDRPEKE